MKAIALLLLILASTTGLDRGDAKRGRDAFVSVGCAGCHTVYRDDKLPKPLRSDAAPMLRAFERQEAEAVAMLIVRHSKLNPEDWLDSDMTMMSKAVDRMTVGQLVDVVAYLRSIRR